MDMVLTGLDKHLKKVREIAGPKGDAVIGIAVQETALLGLEAITQQVDILKLVDTGTYKRGFIVRQGSNPLEAFITTNVAYALALEYGINKDVVIRAHTSKSKKGKTFTVKSHTRRMIRPAYLVVTSQLPAIRRIFIQSVRRQMLRLKGGA